MRRNRAMVTRDTKLIKLFLLFGIAKYLVCFGDCFEGIFVSSFIGVVLSLVKRREQQGKTTIYNQIRPTANNTYLET
jgi:hypothetical protein